MVKVQNFERLGKVFDPEHPLTLKEFFDSRLCFNLYASAHHIVSIWQAQIKEEPARIFLWNFFWMRKQWGMEGTEWWRRIIGSLLLLSFSHFISLIFFFIPFFTPSLVRYTWWIQTQSHQQQTTILLWFSRSYSYYYRAFYDYYSVLLSLFHFSSWKFVVFHYIYSRWRQMKKTKKKWS